MVDLAEYKITTDILAPSDKKTLEYTGFHPTRIIKMMEDIIKDTLKVEGGDVFTDRIKWDVSGDPISFYGDWRGKYAFDSRTSANFKINAQGSQGAKDRIGKIKITIKGSVETKFPSTTFLHKSLVPIYMYAFYSKQRREYVNAGKVLISRIEDEIRSMFNLIKRSG
jgi:hypothetical protein